MTRGKLMVAFFQVIFLFWDNYNCVMLTKATSQHRSLVEVQVISDCRVLSAQRFTYIILFHQGLANIVEVVQEDCQN